MSDSSLEDRPTLVVALLTSSAAAPVSSAEAATSSEAAALDSARRTISWSAASAESVPPAALGRRGDLGDVVPHARRLTADDRERLVHRGHPGRAGVDGADAAVHGLHRAARLLLHLVDERPDAGGGVRRLLGQLADLVRDHGEAAALLAGPAASMAALSASRFVCPRSSLIVSTISPISCPWRRGLHDLPGDTTACWISSMACVACWRVWDPPAAASSAWIAAAVAAHRGWRPPGRRGRSRRPPRTQRAWSACSVALVATVSMVVAISIAARPASVNA